MLKPSLIAPEVVLFIKASGNTNLLKIHYESAELRKQDFKLLMGPSRLKSLIPTEDGGIKIELRNRAFIIRSWKINECQIDNDIKATDFVKMIWPGQSVVMKIGEFDFEFRVENCNY